MNDQKKDKDLDEVRAALKGLNAMRGKCPSSEDLVRYQQRSLSTEEMLLIKQHLNLCGLCDWAVTQLAEFDSVAIPLMQEERQPERSRSPLRYFLYPALALALVFVLFIPIFYFTIQPHTPLLTNPMEGVGSARDFNLEAESGTRSTSAKQKTLILLSPSERFFILNIFIPIRENHTYQMEIVNERDQLVDSTEIKSRDALGNFSIVCGSNLFPDGDYRLKVKVLEKQTVQVNDEYHFSFRVKRQQ